MDDGYALRLELSGKSKIDGGGAGMAHESSISFITGGVRSGKELFCRKDGDGISAIF